MRNYTHRIGLADTELIVAFANEHDYTIYSHPGTLNDAYLIHTDKTMRVNKIQPREYVVLYYTYAGPYHNNLWCLHTDNRGQAEELFNAYGCQAVS